MPLRFVLAAILGIAAFLAIMIMSQDELLFPTGSVPPAGPLPSSAQQFELQVMGGDTLRGVHLKPVTESDRPRLLIIGFGGNAWNAQDAAEYLHGVFPDAHVVAFHYRGYRPSTGSPSASALLEDAPLIHRLAVQKVGPDRTVAVGFSIGSGVAASIAGKVDGLVLVTPFDSLKAVAAELYPWLPIGPFFRHEMNSIRLLAGTPTPVAILSAGQDEIIPPARTDALRRSVPNLVFNQTIAGAGHNDIYYRKDFQTALHAAVVAVAGK